MTRYSPPGKIPHGPEIKRRLKLLGLWEPYLAKREDYKLQGLTPREAVIRTYTEMGIAEKWEDYQKREAQKVILGSKVPLTPVELKKVHPNYKAPSVTPGSPVGQEVLSLPEQIRWVKQQIARVRNGEESPAEFPSDDTLFWWQIAITRPRDFDSIVMKTEAPGKDSDDLMVQDGEYQFREIEKQIAAARDEALRDGAEAAAPELAVSA